MDRLSNKCPLLFLLIILFFGDLDQENSIEYTRAVSSDFSPEMEEFCSNKLSLSGLVYEVYTIYKDSKDFNSMLDSLSSKIAEEPEGNIAKFFKAVGTKPENLKHYFQDTPEEAPSSAPPSGPSAN